MYKIEITAETLAELSGKVLSLASKLMTGTAAEGVSAPKAAKAEVAEAAPANPTPAPKSAPVAEATESQPTTPATSSTPAPAASVSEDEELEVVDLPIAVPEVNLRDLVLSVVEKRGKPFMEEILTRFGVAKASMVSPELLPELIALCNEALVK